MYNNEREQIFDKEIQRNFQLAEKFGTEIISKEKFHYDEKITARGYTPCISLKEELLNWFIGKIKDEAIGTNIKIFPSIIDGEKVLVLKESKNDSTQIQKQ